MNKNTNILILFFAALALFTVPANAAKQANDTSEIDLTFFVPCAAGGSGRTCGP
jgi:tripartite-type tricarboxylate transporter receptor subunit TctC